MKHIAFSAFVCFVGSASALKAAEPASHQRVFLKTHCMDCHDSASKEGGLDLSTIDFKLLDAATFSLWVKVHDRVRDGEMPPKDAFATIGRRNKKVLNNA